MSLFISVNTASSELAQSPISDAITFLAAQATIEKRNGLLPGGPSLDVTFLLPGQLDKPAFSGMHMGGYSLECNTLFFETAVPEHILRSDSAPYYVALVMQDIVNNASEFFMENDIQFDAPRWHEIVHNLTESETTGFSLH